MQPHPYDRHVGRYGAGLARGLIALAGVSRGDAVLDVGCGTGQLTAQLAEAAGGGNVSALDPSAEVVAVCQARVPDADVRVGSAEALPFADGQFAAVLAQLVVNLVDDPPAAVREMARVAQPGATIAACFWDDEEMPLLRSFWDAARSCAPEAVSAISARGQVGLADLSLLEEWWQVANLTEITLGRFKVSAGYEDFDDLWAPFEAGVGGSGRLYRSLDGELQEATREDARRRLGSPTGPFELTAGVRTVRGVRA